MKQIILLILLILVAFHLASASHETSLSVNAISFEKDTVDGLLDIEFEFVAFDTVILDTNFSMFLPEGWEISGDDNIRIGQMLPNDTAFVELSFEYSLIDLPFHPVSLRFFFDSMSPGGDGTYSSVYVYFTPYYTVEVWSYYDFVQLQRNWFAPCGVSAQRSYVNPDSIPASNIPIEYEPVEAWEEEIQSVHIPGLAYSIPMLATHPDTLALDTTDHAPQDSSTRWDNCLPGFRRYIATVSGQVVSDFNYIQSQNFLTLPLEGLKVQIWEDDGPTISDPLGATTTNSDGTFSITINTCQALEGGSLEIFTRVVARNEEYNIKGKNQRIYGLVKHVDTAINTLAYNNGIASTLPFGTINVDNGAHRAVHLLQSAYQFTNANSGITLDNKIVVRADINVNNNRFVPNTYCGLPYIQTGQVALAAFLNVPLAVVYYLVNRPEPNILLNVSGANVENTPLHEFGHFVLWQLQGKCLTEPLSQTASGHCPNCHSNPRLAWNEGWPSAFSMMVDASNFDWDNEYEFYGKRTYEDLYEPFDVYESSEGFTSEYLVSCAIYDLWDGADKFSNGPTPMSASIYDDRNVEPNSTELWTVGEEDQVSLSFEDLCLAVSEGDYDAPNNVIESIQGYYNNIVRWRGCEDRAKIAKVFDQNRIVGYAQNFPTGDYRGFSGDEIFQLEPHSYGGTLWSHMFQHEHDVSTLAYAPNQDYNLATQTQNGSKFLNDDLLVTDGASLLFNKNIPMGWIYYNSPDRPALNSTMQTDLCGGMTLEVVDDGHVVIGDQAVSAHADVHLNPGGTIILGGDDPGDAGNLLINNHSSLHIEPGATLVIDQGAHIELDGTDAVLEIDGDLVIRDGATFTFTGSGYVLWGNTNAGANVTCGQNTAISLQGSGKSDLILQVKPGAHLQPEVSLEQFDIVDGKVLMGDGASISTADAAFTLDNLDVQLDGTTGAHKGIYVHGQANHRIEDVEVSGATKGITAYQYWNQMSVLRLKNCDFHDCGVGLQVHRQGVNMVNCSFHDNNVGYQQDLGDVLSMVDFCTFEDNATGIEFRSGQGDLYFRESDADNNEYGIRFSGPGNLYGKCGSTSENSQAGIAVAFGANLQLNDWLNPSGSHHIATGNAYSIQALFPQRLDMLEGENNLQAQQTNANRDVYGYMAIPNTTACTLKTHYNHWNPSNGSPVYNMDYLLANLNSGQLYPAILKDDHPISTVTCSYSSGGGGGSGSTLRNCGECTIIRTTHFDDIPLDSAMRTAMRYMSLIDTTQNDSLALEYFAEIAGAYPNSPNEEEMELLDALVALTKTAFNSACASGRISLQTPGSISNDPAVQHLQTVFETVPTGDALSEFLSGLDQTLFEHTQGFMDTTLIQLDSLMQASVTGFDSYLEYASCYVEAETQVIAEPNSRDEFDAMVANCIANKWREDDLLRDGSLERFAAGMYGDNSVIVFPSPSRGETWVNVTGVGANVQPNLMVYDALGRQIALPIIIEGAARPLMRFRMDTRMLPAGMYIVQIDLNGRTLSRKWMVE